MTIPKYQSPFPPLHLNLADKKELCQITKRLVGEVLEGYERFVWTDGCKLNPARWSILREREDVHVYHDRRSATGSNGVESKDLHVLLTIGTVVGTLDDAMYGVLNPTTNAMRLKTAYVHDSIVNCALLATVQEPKDHKPFRSMTVKWIVQAMPFHMRALSKNRDVVLVEATGLKTLPNGERIGYHLQHSIGFTHTQPLPTLTRSNMSMCCIWRQLGADRVQAYHKSFLDVPEKMLAPLVLRSAADNVLSVWRYMHCAQMKKLAWLMRRGNAVTNEHEAGHDSKPRHKDNEPREHPHHPSVGSCATCGSHAHSARQGNKSRCTICSRLVCSTCRLKRELCLITPDGRLIEQRAVFCVQCISVAVRASALEIARDEICEQQAKEPAPHVHKPHARLVHVDSTARFSHPIAASAAAADSSRGSHSHHNHTKERNRGSVTSPYAIASAAGNRQ